MPALKIRRPGQQPALKLEPRIDFTGGLNLTKDRFTLGPNESPGMLNVDVQRRGGIESRKVVAQYGDDAPAAWVAALDVTRVFNHIDAVGGGPQVLVCQDGAAHYGTGAAWTALSALVQHTDHCQLNGLSFLVSADYDPSYSWDGSTLTAMTNPAATAWQNDYSVPSGAHMPLASLCAQHLGYVWVADTSEGGTRYESRVRVSHPNDAGSWAEDDYVDIGLGDGEAIQRIIPFRDHLVVVKETTMYAIYGYDRSTFQPVELSPSVGATNYHAVASSPGAVWIFSADRGLYVWDGQQVQWAFEKLYPHLRDEQFAKAKLDEVQIGWVRDRVWVRIEDTDGSVYTYPFDPALGAWTKYDLDVTTFCTYHDTNGTPSYLATTAAADHLLTLQQDGTQDDFGDGVVDVESFYETTWIDGGSPFLPKRWKRPEFIVRSALEHQLQVEAFTDYNDTEPFTVFFLNMTGPAGGSDLVWDVGNWDDNTWAGEVGVFDEIVRGGSIGGSGRSLLFKFTGPTSVQWEVRGFTLKYRPKNPRG